MQAYHLHSVECDDNETEMHSENNEIINNGISKEEIPHDLYSAGE